MGMPQANNRMQLTWLLGAPVHGGFGSLARRRAGRPRFIRHAADAGRYAAPVHSGDGCHSSGHMRAVSLMS